MATETRPVDPGDPYIDPPRSWKRVGLLAGVWIALWVTVGTMGWVAMQIPALTPDDRPKGTNAAPEDAVKSFLDQAYGRGQIDPSQLFVCGEATAPDVNRLRAERDQLEITANKGLALRETHQVQPGVVNGDTATVEAKIYFGAAEEWDWVFQLRKNGGWEICGYDRTLVSSWTPPNPSSS